MVFIELRFFLFFLIVFGVHWALRGRETRKVWLLLASYGFYAAWDPRFLSLIWLSTAIDYLVGRGLLRWDRDRTRKVLLIISLTANLAILGTFKYLDFFAESAQQLLHLLGFSVTIGQLNLVLPVGISFYTFQTMSYSIDAYRRKITPTRNLLDFALFVGFFPQLVAGPIVRAVDFMPQLAHRKVLADVRVRAMLTMFFSGYIMKAVVADNAAILVDAYFKQPDAFRGWTALVTMPLYAIQIYGDFAGYSAMAIASAGLLGYAIPENFRFPYLSRNVTEFWRRWHISLSGWLRDYLYIPLGGNRRSRRRTYINLLLVMVLGGLWHGAAWTFVMWGGLHGCALAVHHWWTRDHGARPRANPISGVTAVAATFLFWCFTMIMFRSPDLHTAWTVTRQFLLLDGGGSMTAGLAVHGGTTAVVAVLVSLAAIHWLNYRGFTGRLVAQSPDWVFAAGFGALVPLAFALTPSAIEPFIYFQF